MSFYDAFVDNIPKDGKIPNLKDIFSQFGQVEKVTIKDGFAFIAFVECQSLLNAVDNSGKVSYDKTPLIVEVAKSSLEADE